MVIYITTKELMKLIRNGKVEVEGNSFGVSSIYTIKVKDRGEYVED